MFVAVAEEFMSVLAGTATPSCTIEHGVDVLRMVEAVRQSSRTAMRSVVLESGVL